MTREEHRAQDRAALLAWRRSHVAGALPDPEPARPHGTHPCPYGCGYTTDYPPDMAAHVESAHPDEGREP